MQKADPQLILLLAACLGLGGCQMQGMGASGWGASEDTGDVEPVPEEWYLDAGIMRFIGAVTDEEIEEGEAFQQVRAAETLYFPQQLRRAMQRSGGWRNVWIIPQRAVPDLRIEGNIVTSNGSELELEIRATDATGSVWLERTYEHEFSEADYADEATTRATDDLFDRIAKDLLVKRDRRGVEAMKEIRAVAELRFAQSFAPEAFERYIQEEDERLRLAALPAQEDTLYQLVLQVKERDDMFIESIQGYTENFSEKIDAPYRDWAEQSFYERRARDEGVVSSLTQGLIGLLAIAGGIAVAADGGNAETRQLGQLMVLGGAYATYDAYESYESTDIHQVALKELGQSLNLEVGPQVVQVENQTHTLTGSVEEQYEQWRDILGQVYIDERGGVN